MTDLPANVRWQLWIVAFGFFMQSLDTTIVNTALPSMAKSLGESPLHMHMVIVAYVLTVAVMLPASGWLADKVGVRNIFFTAIVLFTTGFLDPGYRRFIQRRLRELYDFEGTPIVINMRVRERRQRS